MRIKKDNSLCIVIDMQERLFPHIFKQQNLEKNTHLLLRGLQLLNVPIFISEQYVKGLGETILSIQSCCKNSQKAEKRSFSCCDDENMMNTIKSYNKSQIILVGIESHVCVLQTTLDLVDSGFSVFVIEDCVSSRKEQDRKVAIKRMRQEGAFISTYESILFELTQSSSAQEFKEISKLVK